MEKSEKGTGLLEKIITVTGEPLTRKKAIYYSCKLKKLLSGCLTKTAYYIVLLFLIPTKTESNVRRCGKLVNHRVTTGT